MKKRTNHTNYLLVAGVAALVSSSIVALAGLSVAQTTTTSGDAATTSGQPTTSTAGDAATTSGQPVTSTAGYTGQSAPAPQQGNRIDVGPNGIATCYDAEGRSTQDQECQKKAGTYHESGQTDQWGGQQQSGSQGDWQHQQQGGQQWGNQQGWMGCGSSPENPSGYGYHWACQNGAWAREADGQQGSGQQNFQYGAPPPPMPPQEGPVEWPEEGIDVCGAVQANGGHPVCFQGTAWNGNARVCAKMGLPIVGHECVGPVYQIDRQDHRGGPQQYHGGPSGPPMMRGGQGGFPGGMGGGMMGGPGGGMGDRCDMFDSIIEEMQNRLTEMDEETADRWSEMEDHMREKAADQIDRLKDKMEDTDDVKKIAKYEKQIAKVEAKIEKQITKMKARFEKQTAKMKARMEKELAKLEEKAAECEDEEDSDGGGWEGGGGNMGPSFGF